MGQELYISSSNNANLVLQGIDTLTGKAVGTGTTGVAKEIWVDSATPALRWPNSADTQDYQARGVSDGATTEPDGSIWVSGANKLYFAYLGTKYHCNTAQIYNNHDNDAEIEVYSDSGRTNLITTIQFGSTWTSTTFYDTFYCRGRGLTRTGDTDDFTISNVKAGYLYTVTGTYTKSVSAVYSCDCEYDYGYTSSTDDSFSGSCSDRSNGECTFGNQTCQRVCSYCDPCGYWACDRYKCNTNLVSSGSSDSWSWTVTES